MAQTSAAKGLIVSCVLIVTGPAWAQTETIKAILSTKPDFADVQITTPAPDEYAACEARLVDGGRPGSKAYLLLDAKKKPLRRFYSSGTLAKDGKSHIEV